MSFNFGWRIPAFIALVAFLIAGALWFFGFVPWWVIPIAPIILAITALAILAALTVVGVALWIRDGAH